MKHISEGNTSCSCVSQCALAVVSVVVCHAEQADEYLQPLKELEEAQQRRIKTAGT